MGSYQATHGTVRPAPAKSIDGASAFWLGSMFSDAGKPCVVHAPPLKARTKICCARRRRLLERAHGTRAPPAASDPPTTSETPASWPGSIRRRVVVDLAVGRQLDDLRRGGAREREHGDEGSRREAPTPKGAMHECLLRGERSLSL